MAEISLNDESNYRTKNEYALPSDYDIYDKKAPRNSELYNPRAVHDFRLLPRLESAGVENPMLGSQSLSERMNRVIHEMQILLKLGTIDWDVKVEPLERGAQARVNFDASAAAATIHLDDYFLKTMVARAKDGDYSGLAALEYKLAHEIYHGYTAQRFPEQLEKTIAANESSNEDDYLLNKGEKTADLWGYKHLMAKGKMLLEQGKDDTSSDQYKEGQALINYAEIMNQGRMAAEMTARNRSPHSLEGEDKKDEEGARKNIEAVAAALDIDITKPHKVISRETYFKISFTDDENLPHLTTSGTSYEIGEVTYHYSNDSVQVFTFDHIQFEGRQDFQTVVLTKNQSQHTFEVSALITNNGQLQEVSQRPLQLFLDQIS